MTVETLNAANPPPDRVQLVPQYYDPDLIVTPESNPAHSPAMLADLEASIREFGQLVPGRVHPSSKLPDGKLLCLEGNGRLAVVRRLGLRFWAFNLGHDVPEEDFIRLIFSYNYIRRRMPRDEVAERGARFMELTGCSQGEAARLLHVSPATLSRILGETRIPPGLKERASLLTPSIRPLVASAPLELMPKAFDFALTPREGGKNPTRDQVAAYIGQLKKNNGQPKGRKPKAIPLRMNGRTVTLTVEERDSAASVAEDLKAIAAKLGKHADVAPEGWPFLFQQ